MSQAKVRQSLFCGSIVIVAAVLGFLWLLNSNQSAELKRTFLVYIIVLWVFSAAAFALFYFKGRIFKLTGGIERNNIMMITVIVLIIVQITFAFSSYAYQEMNFSFRSYDHAHELFKSTDWTSQERMLQKTAADLPREIDRFYIVDDKGNLEYAQPPISAGDDINYQPIDRYIFPLPNNKILGMHISKEYYRAQIRQTIMDLFTVMVVSLFFGFELVLFLIRFLETRMNLSAPGARAKKRLPPSHCINFIRQLAFLFYFSSRMAATFIPALASRLAGNAFSGGGSVAASIPLSAETLLTCAAIFLTSELIIKKGWKQPYVLGLLFVSLGTFLSAWTQSFLLFIIARAVVGLGYGFCWMTLRNLSLFGLTDNERSWGFTMLNAGVFAGMNCGQVVGSILAQTLGYRQVLIISGLGAMLSGLAILFLKNGRLAAPEHETVNAQARSSPGEFRPIIQMLAVLLLLVIPSCIVGAFSDFYTPLYAVEIGKDTSDVGRIFLLYGIVIIYLGPKMSEVFRNRLGGGIKINIFYNALLAAGLLLSGFFGGFGILVVSIIIIGLADGFGFGAQNDYFLSLPFMAKIPPSRALSILSFLKKLAAMLGPIVFAICLHVTKTRGILIIGIAVLAAALMAITLKNKRKEN
jgi:predicted MFS family arabinose efflux permease